MKLSKNRFLSILCIFILIVSSFGIAYANSNYAVDQQQTNWNSEMIICNNDVMINFAAQSFKPSKSTLTNVEVYIQKYYSPSQNLKFYIRSDLNGGNLASLTKSPSQISTSKQWVNFDFPDISVIVDNTYYIVLEMDYNLPSPTGYLWAWHESSPYSRGAIYNKFQGGPWEPYVGYPNGDACFKTYGISSYYPPSVTTNAATSVSSNVAVLNGYLDDLGEASQCSVWFEYGTTTSYGESTGVQSRSSPSSFSYYTDGLDPGTTYHFRAVAQNDVYTSFGSDRTFTTDTSILNPSVTTNAASSIGDTTATLNGNRGASSCEVWFEYGTTTSYGSSTSHQTRTSTGSFNQALTGLVKCTTYHFRAVAENSAGTTYGSDMTFTTTGCATLPTVTTNAASSIGDTTATLNGNLDNLVEHLHVKSGLNTGQQHPMAAVRVIRQEQVLGLLIKLLLILQKQQRIIIVQWPGTVLGQPMEIIKNSLLQVVEFKNLLSLLMMLLKLEV